MPNPERTRLKDGPAIARVICGLWQVADLEKDGTAIDPDRGADALEAYVRDGFDTFDMADHYGSAELIAGRLLARGRGGVALTKWCPEPGPMTPEVVRAGVEERLARLGVARLDLLQFHWWSFEHPAWLDALHELARLRREGLIGAIGVTNFDAAHLALALAEGIPLVSNQVSFSLLDRRAAGPLTEFCGHTGVRLLAYGTLCGGFLSERWLGAPEPGEMPDWSRAKYRRFINAAGGWDPFQGILAAAGEIARKHGVSLSNVATRWVLDHPAVAAVIVGARITENEHRADNARLFTFALDAEDRARLEAAFAATTPIPGDCGDEYRRPPYLTASGDLSHHLDAIPSIYAVEPVPGRPRPPARRLRQRLGGDRRLCPRGARRRPHPRLRHHRHPRRPPLRRPRQPRRPDHLHPRQDRRRHHRPRRQPRGRRPHPHLRPRRRPLGARRPRPRPRLRRGDAREHARRGLEPRRRLRGRDRGGGRRRRLSSD